MYGVGIAVEIVRRVGLLEYISATTTYWYHSHYL